MTGYVMRTSELVFSEDEEEEVTFQDGALVGVGMRLLKFPSVNGFNPQSITRLDLMYNKIDHLPEDLGIIFSSLEAINMNGNNLTGFPQSICLLKKLQILSAKENNIQSLPDAIGSCSALRVISLEGNLLTSLPESIGQLTQLVELVLSENRLTSLPESLKNLTKLLTLDVSYNNLTKLCDSIGGLISLKSLQVSHNKLTELPSSFSLLPSLKRIELANNTIETLPSTLSCCDTIEILVLEENVGLSILPEWIGFLPNLVEFNSANTRLRGNPFPESFGATSVNLEVFDISGNMIDFLPESFGKLSHLNRIDTGSAKFEPERFPMSRQGNNLTGLPFSFGTNYPLLVSLRLDECNLKSLPEDFGSCMPSLKLLDLHINSLTCLPDSFTQLKSLEICIMSLNHLTHLPEQMGHLVNLQELVLTNNQLRFIPESIRYLAHLTSLDLYGNQLETIPSFLQDMTSIRKLDIDFAIDKLVQKRKIPRAHIEAIGMEKRKMSESWSPIKKMKALISPSPDLEKDSGNDSPDSLMSFHEIAVSPNSNSRESPDSFESREYSSPSPSMDIPQEDEDDNDIWDDVKQTRQVAASNSKAQFEKVLKFDVKRNHFFIEDPQTHQKLINSFIPYKGNRHISSFQPPSCRPEVPHLPGQFDYDI